MSEEIGLSFNDRLVCGR